MKVKYLVIVSLILAILTIGAVSASEDITSDDSLAVGDAADEPIGESAADDVLADDDLNMDVDISSYDDIEYGDEYGAVVTVNNYEEFNVTGSLVVSTGQNIIYSNDKVVVPGYEESDENFFQLTAKDMPNLPLGTYILNVKFTPQVGNPIVSNDTITVTYSMKLYEQGGDDWYEIDEYANEIQVYGDEDTQIRVNLPKSVTDNVIYSIDGVNKTVNMNNGVGYITIPSTTMSIAPHVLIVQCGDKKRTLDVTVEPIVHSLEFVGTNQDVYVGITLPKIYSGTLYVYNYNPNTGQPTTLVGQAAVTGGKGTVALPKLQKGEHPYLAKFDSASYKYEEFFTVNAIDNSPNVVVSVTPSEIAPGGSVTVNANGPLGEFDLYVDGVYQKGFYSKTSFVEVISNLAAGQHRINVIHYGENGADYSGLFYVTVKQKTTPAKDTVKLTLKKFKTVKKSAKKLVLKATLKINGKAKKGLKVKFKFNKKAYTAKTNKKGVAKVTIKAKVLKKLKVGKKVTVQASYGKTVKKFTVKVKK